MTKPYWTKPVKEIRLISEDWKRKKLETPYLCDYLIALKKRDTRRLHQRVLIGALASTRVPYPNLYNAILELNLPGNDYYYYLSNIQRILDLFLSAPPVYGSTTEDLLFDNPDVISEYNILHPKKLAPLTTPPSNPNNPTQCPTKSSSV
jgi:hypothetical protein